MSIVDEITQLLSAIFSPPSAKVLPMQPKIDANQLFLAEVAGWLGTHEEGGNNRGKQVEEFQRAVDGSADGEAWCMAFLQFCIKQIEQRHNIRSRIFRSESCLDTWNNSRQLRITADAVRAGDIIIWQHGDSDNGHTGVLELAVRDTEGALVQLHTIEGNTSDSSMREGDSVARKLRNAVADGDMHVVGYLRAFA